MVTRVILIYREVGGGEADHVSLLSIISDGSPSVNPVSAIVNGSHSEDDSLSSQLNMDNHGDISVVNIWEAILINN